MKNTPKKEIKIIREIKSKIKVIEETKKAPPSPKLKKIGSEAVLANIKSSRKPLSTLETEIAPEQINEIKENTQENQRFDREEVKETGYSAKRENSSRDNYLSRDRYSSGYSGPGANKFEKEEFKREDFDPRKEAEINLKDNFFDDKNSDRYRDRKKK